MTQQTRKNTYDRRDTSLPALLRAADRADNQRQRETGSTRAVPQPDVGLPALLKSLFSAQKPEAPVDEVNVVEKWLKKDSENLSDSLTEPKLHSDRDWYFDHHRIDDHHEMDINRLD